MNRLPDHIAARLRPVGECLEWTGYVNPKGYGGISVKGIETKQVHRVVYTLLKGDPGELTIDHLCRNKVCVNIDHLEAVDSRGEQPSPRCCSPHMQEGARVDSRKPDAG